LKYTRGSTIDSITGFLLFVNYFFCNFQKNFFRRKTLKISLWFVAVSSFPFAIFFIAREDGEWYNIGIAR